MTKEKIKSIHYAKIPKDVKAEGCVAIGRFAVFAGLIVSSRVVDYLYKRDQKQGLPAVGFVIYCHELLLS